MCPQTAYIINLLARLLRLTAAILKSAHPSRSVCAQWGLTKFIYIYEAATQFAQWYTRVLCIRARIYGDRRYIDCRERRENREMRGDSRARRVCFVCASAIVALNICFFVYVDANGDVYMCAWMLLVCCCFFCSLPLRVLRIYLHGLASWRFCDISRRWVICVSITSYGDNAHFLDATICEIYQIPIKKITPHVWGAIQINYIHTKKIIIYIYMCIYE